MVNKVIIIGNLGRDPELRYIGDNRVCNFSVATTEKWRGQDGQMQEQTEWHRCAAWGRLAEICGEYLRKGSRVYVEGKLQTRKWQDQNGADRYSTEINVREMKMLGERRELPQSASPPAPSGRGPEQGPGQASLFEGGGRAAAGGSPPHNPPGYDDVPF